MPYIIVLSGGQQGHGLNLVSNIKPSLAVGDKAESGGGSLVSTSKLTPLNGNVIILDESVSGVSPIIDGVQASLNTSTSDGSSSQTVVRTLIIGGALPQFNGNSANKNMLEQISYLRQWAMTDGTACFVQIVSFMVVDGKVTPMRVYATNYANVTDYSESFSPSGGRFQLTLTVQNDQGDFIMTSGKDISNV